MPTTPQTTVMMAMDVPLSAACAMAFAEAGKNMIRSEDPDKTTLVRLVVRAFAGIAVASNGVYYMLGWPAWETNFLWRWVDDIMDHPTRAAFAHGLVAMSVIPAWLGFELARKLLLKGKDRLVRIIYIVLFALVGVVVLVLWDSTFNVASTYAKYEAGEFYSFWTLPFATGWAITAAAFWAAFFAIYLWLRKKS